jgi:RimJ/RimL family protein N-acetyltransferase
MDLSTLDFETERLHLRAYRETDAPDIFAGITPEICEYMTFDPAQSVDEIRELGRKWLVLAAEGREVAVPIRDKASTRLLGMGGIHYRKHPRPGLGIWIRADAQGQGYGREAIAGLIGYVRDVLGEPEVHYIVAEENVRSRRIPESLGGEVCGSETVQRPSGPPHPGLVYRIALS